MDSNIIDLRSDTVTLPDDAMREAMASSPIGDDVYEEDPTAKSLERTLSQMAGHETGLFFPTGTQSNLVALLTHCQRGEEYIVGQEAHTYKYEAGGAAVLGSIQPQPIELDADGTMPLAKIKKAIKADDFHFARTRLLALENTTAGKIIPLSYVAEAKELTRQHGMRFHLDGARAFNAAVGLGVSLEKVTQPFDSVSICLSKGLGAPVGSVLLGNEEFIHQAKRWRKMVGGGMRQIGMLAGAGLYAIENNVDRLLEDHKLAAQLAERLLDVDGLIVHGNQSNTNMVYLSASDDDGAAFHQWCAERGLKFGGRNPARLVIHRHITEADIVQAADIIRSYFENK
ncbi:MAG: low-specificity L-threonine aldolase [Acidiferrobacterales bacterium]|nr:low-specificity L-threonine aldolase [Acidiferrobacterales bacterium]